VGVVVGVGGVTAHAGAVVRGILVVLAAEGVAALGGERVLTRFDTFEPIRHECVVDEGVAVHDHFICGGIGIEDALQADGNSVRGSATCVARIAVAAGILADL